MHPVFDARIEKEKKEMLKIALSGIALSFLTLLGKPTQTSNKPTNRKENLCLTEAVQPTGLNEQQLKDAINELSNLSELELQKLLTNFVKFGYSEMKSIRFFDYSKISKSDAKKLLLANEKAFDILKNQHNAISGIVPETDFEKMLIKFIKHSVLHFGNFISNLKEIANVGYSNVDLLGRTSSSLKNSMASVSTNAILSAIN